jgi:acyl-CoA synthetase (AMP-forming)/AMP-acid ligase II
MSDSLALDALLERTAAAHPDAAAIGFRADAISFATLHLHAGRVAAGLASEGRPGDRVAIVGRNSAAQVELILGAVRARQVALPVNWRLTAREMAYIFTHSSAARIFCDGEFLPTVEAALAGREVPVHVFDGDLPTGYPAWRDRQDVMWRQEGAAPTDVVFQMYTSGTTGLPKGVQLTGANIMSSLAIFSRPPLDLGPGDAIYAPAPMFHITGIGPMLRCVQSGARLLLPDHFAPDRAVREMAAEGVSYTTLAPAMIQSCLASPEMSGADLSSLRVIVYGGSPIAESVLREAQDRIGCAFVQCYGLTETTGPITMLGPDDHAPGRGKLASCGRAVAGITIRIADEAGVALPSGETGEVLVAGPLNMAGYADDPAATAEILQGEWLRTGDAGYLDDDGYLFIRDRVKDMIVSGGENIYPVEVENALQSHPEVADSAVIGIPDAAWGERVIAFVVPSATACADTASLLDHCRRLVAGYKCPREIHFVESIPRNAAGKILRRELREPFWRGNDRKVG